MAKDRWEYGAHKLHWKLPNKPPQMKPCEKALADGHRCPQTATTGSRFCYFHDKQTNGVPVCTTTRAHWNGWAPRFSIPRKAAPDA